MIATYKRTQVLEKCLDSLLAQTLFPDEVIVSYYGNNPAIKSLLVEQGKYGILNVKYHKVESRGAAIQRNLGAEEAKGDILLFLDDDIICEPDFVKEITDVFLNDSNGTVGGASGIVVNSSYVPLSRMNKLLFDLCVKKLERRNEYAGMVVGPAVNFWPKDIPNQKQEAQWLPSGCCAYRRGVFLSHKFNEGFYGYSFMEDVELSCRVAKSHRLTNTTKARLYHMDLGGKTHENWIEIGKMQVLNRWHVMTEVLDKRSPSDKCRFFYYQIYCVITESKLLFKWPELKYTLLRWWGRMLGCLKVFKT